MTHLGYYNGVKFAFLSHISLQTRELRKCEKKWYFVTKIVLTYCEKKNSSDREKLLKFEAEGREFLRSVKQFIQTEAFFVTEDFFHLKLEKIIGI